ncbi:MAG TPA: YciI family protein, partial [Pyrinomonadaceae bacterium]|nr:YciI family protein [Pyrinomonadaceae bacterium]
YDMGRMQLVFLHRAADWKPSDEAHAARLRDEHRAFVNGLVESGRLALGGPVAGAEGGLQEIMVFKVETLAEALAAVAESPAVKSGMLKPDGLSWFAARNYITPPKKPLAMKEYVFGVLVRGPKWTKEVTAETKQLQAGHMANINRLAQAGKLVLAGPFEGDGERRGVFIFKVPTIAEAQTLTDTDPAVAAGRLKIELHRWSVPEGTLK